MKLKWIRRLISCFCITGILVGNSCFASTASVSSSTDVNYIINETAFNALFSPMSENLTAQAEKAAEREVEYSYLMTPTDSSEKILIQF